MVRPPPPPPPLSSLLTIPASTDQDPSPVRARPAWPPPLTPPPGAAPMAWGIRICRGRLPKDTSLDLHPPLRFRGNAWGIVTSGAPKGCCAKGGRGPSPAPTCTAPAVRRRCRCAVRGRCRPGGPHRPDPAPAVWAGVSFGRASRPERGGGCVLMLCAWGRIPMTHAGVFSRSLRHSGSSPVFSPGAQGGSGRSVLGRSLHLRLAPGCELLVEQCGHPRQGASLEEFQGGASA